MQRFTAIIHIPITITAADQHEAADLASMAAFELWNRAHTIAPQVDGTAPARGIAPRADTPVPEPDTTF